ncbi:MAG: hypothetical protein J7641_22595 [Cyanobacteria bacterium SID2]|nr:hypothetical protein [Cyanobacteria bacterium SID2]MBP0005207.1 hypothetical protein [Cyanobacteria bacterium SBC]
MLSLKADIDEEREVNFSCKETPLILACRYKNIKAVKALLMFGANPNNTSSCWGNPLSISAGLND